MDTIRRYFQKDPYDGSPVDHFVYRKEEADAEGINYKDWREAEPGDWVITDDNWVGQTIYKRLMKGKKATAYELTFSFGKQIIRHKNGVPENTKKLFYEPYRLIGSGYYLITPRPWDEQELRKRRTKFALTLFAHQTITRHGKELSTEDLRNIGKIVFPRAPRPELSMMRLFKSPLIRKMAEKRVDEVLEEMGVTMGLVLDMYDEAYKMAKKKGDALNIIRVADRLSELKQKYMRVEDDFDETIEIDDTPLERAPVPRRLGEGVSTRNGSGKVERGM